MEEQRARQEQEARRGQASSGTDASTSRPETINESKKISFIFIFKVFKDFHTYMNNKKESNYLIKY
jgi:hypothetical protein